MKYKSDILEVIHENALANYEIGAISEAKMLEYDEMCLFEPSKTPQKTEKPEENKQNRLIAV